MNYWNPYLETLSRERFVQIEIDYFRKMFSFAKARSALYREKFKGVDEGDIRSLDNLKKIPLTEKRR